MANIKYTKEVLETIVKECYSYSEVVKRFGLKLTGGNNSNIKKRITESGLDTSHFTGKGWNTGDRCISGTLKYPIDDYLSNKRFIRSHKLKLRLINENLKEHKCEICGISKWQEKELPLELDHINCNHEDNTLSNLQILCPNCHSQKTRNDRSKRVNKS